MPSQPPQSSPRVRIATVELTRRLRTLAELRDKILSPEDETEIKQLVVERAEDLRLHHVFVRSNRTACLLPVFVN
jgi:hypothetical protein